MLDMVCTEMSDTISREAGCPACGCGVPCGECETCSPTPTFAPAPRVTTEQANLLARCEYDPMIQIGLAPPVSASDLAADLLDARAEIERLRADRDCDGNGMTCTHRAALKRCHDLLETASNGWEINDGNEKWPREGEK